MKYPQIKYETNDTKKKIDNHTQKRETPRICMVRLLVYVHKRQRRKFHYQIWKIQYGLKIFSQYPKPQYDQVMFPCKIQKPKQPTLALFKPHVLTNLHID